MLEEARESSRDADADHIKRMCKWHSLKLKCAEAERIAHSMILFYDFYTCKIKDIYFLRNLNRNSLCTLYFRQKFPSILLFSFPP